jgi:hypothetical protein
MVFSNYKIKTNFKGRPYIFVKGKSHLNEFSSVYSVQYYGPEDTIIKYQTTVSITNTEDRARTLFNGHALERGLMKDHLIKTSNSEYNCNDIIFIKKSDYLRLIILKNRIVYTITIENMSVSEIDFGPTLRKKLEYLNDLVRFNKI